MTFQNDRRFARLKTAYSLAVISVLPLAFTSFIWIEVICGAPSRAIDGSGHYAIGQIYDQSIFPETFGWTNAYFAGMAFPNLYPPLFFWIVSLLHHSHIFSFATAFKLPIAVPLICLPLMSWAIAWFHAGKDSNVALGAAAASATLYTLGEIFQPNTGLDMSSTLLDGFYTQPLGYVLLLLWLLVYLSPQQNRWRFVASATVLALTVLANFFNAITAIIFIASVLFCDLVKLFHARETAERHALRNSFLVRCASPALALALTAFWLVPMASSYQFLATRPLIKPLSDLMTVPIWCWYVLAGLGALIWLRRPVGAIGPYLLACFVLFLTLIFAGSFAPVWFPLQVFRFFSTLNSLLVVPIGMSIGYAIDLYVGTRKSVAKTSPIGMKRIVIVTAVTIVALASLAFVMSRKKLTPASAFYTTENYDRIAGVLEFGKHHQDGRYLVEVLPPRLPTGAVRSDSLALNAYLGAQGNETVSIVYREASPNSSFFNAELNTFSAYRENFGLSSALMDDRDFVSQPLSQHLERLQFIGVRYLVVGTSETKARLAHEAAVNGKYEVGPWTIFELRDAQPSVRLLPYRPALVVSDFTVKLRRQNQYDFIRLAEEQFQDAWFDVLLVRSPERRLDLLPDLEKFGALVIDTYDFNDETRALALLKQFAQTRPLVLLSSEAPLFNRLKSSISEFPHAVVIDRPNETQGSWIEASEPSHNYNSSSIRSVWRSIRAELDAQKVSASQNASQVEEPMLLAQTFNPKWVREDNARLYAATPFFSVTFAAQPVKVAFRRDRYDRIALWTSFLTLVGVVIWFGLNITFRQIRPNRSRI